MEGNLAETSESFGDAAGSGSKMSSVVSFLLNVAMSASLNQLWGMIHAL